jgi:hypothetical protein
MTKIKISELEVSERFPLKDDGTWDERFLPKGLPKHSHTIDPKEALASKKMNFDSIPITATLHLSKGNQHGADKYGTYNWLELPDNSMSLMTYINAIHRHWLLLKAGQDLTSDGQVHHLAAIMAGCAVALDAITFGKVKDDRIKLTKEQLKTLEEMINNV